jgi:dipicolinate synthase subunit B
MRRLKALGAELFPIMSHNAYNCDTRFYPAAEARAIVEEICEREVWRTIPDVEPIGPKSLLDLMVVLPCTGNTLGKMANGISDTAVTMACKSHLRNDGPVLLGVSTNDGLSGNAGNIGELMNRKNFFFVPFRQDEPLKKPNSLLFVPELVEEAAASALEKRQLQPLLRTFSNS